MYGKNLRSHKKTRETNKRKRQNTKGEEESGEEGGEDNKDDGGVKHGENAKAFKILAGTGVITVYPMLEIVHKLKYDIDQYRETLKREGYLLLRGVLDRKDVLTARHVILSELDGAGFLKSEKSLMDGEGQDMSVSPNLMSRQDLAHDAAVLNVLESKVLCDLMCSLLACTEVITSQYKWLRAVEKDKFTGCHLDRVYLGDGTSRLLTAWIPLGDIPSHMGTLALADQSHSSERLRHFRETYGQGKVGKDGVQSGWYCSDPNQISNEYGNVRWLTTDFHAGDVCVIGLDVLHMSTTNTTNRYRLSCDTRWQNANEAKGKAMQIQIPSHPNYSAAE